MDATNNQLSIDHDLLLQSYPDVSEGSFIIQDCRIDVRERVGNTMPR